MSIERSDWNYTKTGDQGLGLLSRLRVALWMWWRKPTRVELYKWLLAEFPRSDHALKKHLDVLAKMELLRKQLDTQLLRIETERALLAEDIKQAKALELNTDWSTSAESILTHRRHWSSGWCWNSKLLSERQSA